MLTNFDLNKIRYITRGEVNGSVRFLVLTLCAAVVWMGASWYSGMARSASSSLAISQAHYVELNRLAAEYRSLAPDRAFGEELDVMTAFTQVSSRLELGGRVTRISPTMGGARSVVEVNNLYAEELTDMVYELSIRGISVIAAEIFTIPAGERRLFRLNFTIGREA